MQKSSLSDIWVDAITTDCGIDAFLVSRAGKSYLPCSRQPNAEQKSMLLWPMLILSNGARIEVAWMLVPPIIYGAGLWCNLFAWPLFTDLRDFAVNSVKAHGYTSS